MPDASELIERFAGGEVPLTRVVDCQSDAAKLAMLDAVTLFPGARDSSAALGGLLLCAGCWQQSHELSQNISSREGSYWHAIAHRIEPDSANSAYWFRRVGVHPIFPELHRAAAEILKAQPEIQWRLAAAWDPELFIQWCDEARAVPASTIPGSTAERVAVQIQTCECRLLLRWCANITGTG